MRCPDHHLCAVCRWHVCSPDKCSRSRPEKDGEEGDENKVEKDGEGDEVEVKKDDDENTVNDDVDANDDNYDDNGSRRRQV